VGTTVEVIQLFVEFLVEWKWPIVIFWLIRPFRREIVGTLSRAVDELTQRVSRVKAKGVELELTPSRADVVGAVRGILMPSSDLDSRPSADQYGVADSAEQTAAVSIAGAKGIAEDEAVDVVELAIAVGEVGASQLEFLKRIAAATVLSGADQYGAYEDYIRAHAASGVAMMRVPFDDWGGWIEGTGLATFHESSKDAPDGYLDAYGYDDDEDDFGYWIITTKGRNFLRFMEQLYPARFREPYKHKNMLP
jgi:hypothetical protein